MDRHHHPIPMIAKAPPWCWCPAVRNCCNCCPSHRCRQWSCLRSLSLHLRTTNSPSFYHHSNVCPLIGWLHHLHAMIRVLLVRILKWILPFFITCISLGSITILVSSPVSMVAILSRLSNNPPQYRHDDFSNNILCSATKSKRCDIPTRKLWTISAHAPSPTNKFQLNDHCMNELGLNKTDFEVVCVNCIYPNAVFTFLVRNASYYNFHAITEIGTT